MTTPALRAEHAIRTGHYPRTPRSYYKHLSAGQVAYIHRAVFAPDPQGMPPTFGLVRKRVAEQARKYGVRAEIINRALRGRRTTTLRERISL